MKRYLNYILILSNVLIFIGLVIGLGLFLNWRNSVPMSSNTQTPNPLSPIDVINNMRPVVASPICFMVASCGILFFYEWQVKNIINKTEDAFSVKIFNAIKLVSYTSLVNYIVTCILGISGCLIDDKTLNAQLILLSVGLGFSGLFGLIVIGIISYLNLRISFEQAKLNNNLVKDEKENDVTEKQKNNNSKDDERVTSGSF